MKAAAFILASCALVAVPTAAGAGPCTGEVENLTKVLFAEAAGPSSSPSLRDYQANLGIEADHASSPASVFDEPAAVPPGMSRETTGSTTPLPPAEPKEDRSASQPSHEQIAEAHSMAEAMNALERARLLDQQGKESDCLSAVGMAKLISGFR